MVSNLVRKVILNAYNGNEAKKLPILPSLNQTSFQIHHKFILYIVFSTHETYMIVQDFLGALQPETL